MLVITREFFSNERSTRVFVPTAQLTNRYLKTKL